MNIPNTISLLRILLVPVFVTVYFCAPNDGWNYWAAIVYIIAQSSDVLDGYIARKYNMITKLGRILDPVGDKLMSLSVLICISVTYPYLWWAPTLYFIKEALMAIGALLQFKRIYDIPAANTLGKLSTVVFFSAFVLILFIPDLPGASIIIMLSIALVLTFAALISYLVKFLKR